MYALHTDSNSVAPPQAEADDVDTSGEAQADRVEAAVRQGKPAKGALGGDGGGGNEAGGEHEGDEHDGGEHGVALKPVKAGAAGIGLARKARPALKGGSDFGMGMSFSTKGLEKSYRYKIWDADPFKIPIPAVPGLSFLCGPSVEVKASGGVDFDKKALKTNLGVNGSVSVGFAYGQSKLAEVNAKMTAGASGGFEYTKSKKSWELDGAIKLKTNFSVGVSLGGGIVDYDFEFGECELGSLTGVSWKDGRFDRGALGWNWGDKPKEFFSAINAAIAKVKKQIDKVKKPIKKVVKGAGDVIKHLTSW